MFWCRISLTLLFFSSHLSGCLEAEIKFVFLLWKTAAYWETRTPSLHILHCSPVCFFLFSLEMMSWQFYTMPLWWPAKNQPTLRGFTTLRKVPVTKSELSRAKSHHAMKTGFYSAFTHNLFGVQCGVIFAYLSVCLKFGGVRCVLNSGVDYITISRPTKKVSGSIYIFMVWKRRRPTTGFCGSVMALAWISKATLLSYPFFDCELQSHWCPNQRYIKLVSYSTYFRISSLLFVRERVCTGLLPNSSAKASDSVRFQLRLHPR